MNTKVLFILSSTGTGGIISSYLPLYSYLKGRVDIKTLVLLNKDSQPLVFEDSLISDGLLSSYYEPFHSLDFLHKFWAFLLRPYKKRNLKRGVVMPVWFAKIVAHNIMRKHHFDIVVGFSEGAPTLLASSFKGVKKMAWIHCDYQRYFETECVKHDESEIYQRIDYIVSVSDYTKESFKKIYPTLSSKAVSIYNLLDVDRIKLFSQATVDTELFKTDTFTLISVGRIVPVKRFVCIPIIAKKLKDAGLNFRWYIIGPDSDQVETRQIDEMIRANNLEDVVIRLGEKANPYPYMARSDLYVCLSSSEACPMVFNEAKILKLPMVTTDFGSAFEFITNGVDGIITPIDIMPNVLSRLMKDKKEMLKLKCNISNYGYDNASIQNKLNEIFS